MESAALGSSSTSSSGEDGETLLSFADDDTTKAKDGEEDQWVATHIAQGESSEKGTHLDTRKQACSGYCSSKILFRYGEMGVG